MKRSVLIVDDDPMLLTSMERCLGMQFDLTTAPSGQDALRLMRERDEPFAAAVTDMRMPVMNGLELVRQAQEVSPNTVFAMLTGNQDVETVISAVNETQVFRFLHKPCDPTDIARTIDSCLRQHDLLAAERELLCQTLPQMADALLEAAAGAGQGSGGPFERLAERVDTLLATSEENNLWAPGLAARLVTLGLGGPSEGAGADWRAVCERAAAKIESIPRLEGVAQLLRDAPKATDSAPDPQDQSPEGRAAAGAALLRAAFESADAPGDTAPAGL